MKAIVRKINPRSHWGILLTDSRTHRSYIERGKHAWCVQWQSSQMEAPSFWYYGTRWEARDMARALKKPFDILSESSYT